MAYWCSVCQKTFRSEAALAQHQRDTGHWEEEFVCGVCGKTFKSEAALEQHQRDTGHDYGYDEYAEENYAVEVPEPPVDTPGEWVLREDFEGRKSFGYFVCDCGRFWTSAHAQTEYRQGCQGCEEESLPYFMWRNDGGRRVRREDEPENKPHDASRCEACRRGQCDRALPFDHAGF
mmetsp:Transcript_28124/g.74405  ORF Transcript_28124/g.74405 Transcript_28124/m.74405 type:complete len:176 (-) Transcript_28124:19-546(-)